MATDKLFTVVGTSKLDGETKVRFANDTLRTKVLQKHGHTDIVLVELDNAMTKLEAVQTIQFAEEFQSAAAQSAIADYLDAKAPKVKSVATPTATKKAAPKAKIDISAMEDSPV
jgi:NADH:ubiquinone oxidoreductase subunit E